MTNTKSTKRALLVSVMAMVICFTMLLGTTFAWFTDEVTSSGNIIKSGTLDIKMSWAEADVAPASAVWNASSDTDTLSTMFDYQNYEPGFVEAKHIKIENVGTLDFNFKLHLVATNLSNVSILADKIDVYYFDEAVDLTRGTVGNGERLGTLREVLAADYYFGNDYLDDKDVTTNNTKTITLAFKMVESADNTYQGLALGSDFSVQVLAAQRVSEDDTIGNDYDEDAEW